MSDKIQSAKPWLEFITDFDTPFSQVKYLLKNINRSQVETLTEIFHNLLQNNFELSKPLQKKINSRKWKTLASKNKSFSAKRALVKKRSKDIWQILVSAKSLLEELYSS